MELEQITTLVRYGGDTQGQTAKRLRSLRDRFEGRWGNEGQVAKVFASVHAALGDVQEALKWYARAMAAPDGSSSLRAILANCTALIDRPIPAESHDEYCRQLGSQIRQLEGLESITGTAERAELLGRAWRQLGRFEAGRRQRARYAGSSPIEADSFAAPAASAASMSFQSIEAASIQAECAALAQAQQRFAEAVERHLKEENPGLRLWPALAQVLVATRRQLILGCDVVDADLPCLDLVGTLLAEQNEQRPDFRSKAAEPLLRLVCAINKSGLDDCVQEIIEAYRSLHERLNAPDRWRAVLDDAAFILEPWCGQRAQSRREKRAALALPARLRNYAGLGDEAIHEPPSEPAGEPANKSANKSASRTSGKAGADFLRTSPSIVTAPLDPDRDLPEGALAKGALAKGREKAGGRANGVGKKNVRTPVAAAPKALRPRRGNGTRGARKPP